MFLLVFKCEHEADNTQQSWKREKHVQVEMEATTQTAHYCTLHNTFWCLLVLCDK